MPRPKDPSKWLTVKCKTCRTEFECRKSSLKIYCSKKCSNNDPEVKEKIKKGQRETWDKIGHHMQTDEGKAKHKESMIYNHGVEHALQKKEFLDKSKETFNNKSDEEKKEIYKKVIATKNKKYKNGRGNWSNFYIRKYEEVSKWKHITILTDRESFDSLKPNQRYKFKCNECGHIFNVSHTNGYIPKCKRCAMSKLNTTSRGEQEVREYLQSILNNDSINKDRSILNGYELDIHIPKHNIAIEYNGIYWHSESTGKNKNYHLNKTKLCAQKGIQLIHIFDYQWYLKQDIVKSIISSKLKLNDRIYARKCTVKIIKSNIKNRFLEETHIQGKSNSSINLGLFFNNELVAVMTFGKPRYNKKYEWELIRFSSKLFTTVVGGFSKLLSYFIREYSPSNILSYADRSRGSGEVYIKNGFKFEGITKPNYFYFKDLNVYNRSQFQKHMLSDKLEEFNNELTEVQNMANNGYHRFWDCGNFKYVLNIKK